MNTTTKDHVTQTDFAKNPTMHSLNLFNNNWSINRISREYNTTPKKIVSYLGKNLVVERINALYQSGIEYREIAKIIGLDLRNIYRYLEATRSNDPLTAEEIQKTLGLLCRDYSLTRIASELNKTTKIIQQTLLQECMFEYLSLESLADLQTRYKLSKPEIGKYLRKHNISVLEAGDRTKLVKHIDSGNWQFWRPISPYLSELS
ncbi:MAG: hypothetical protein HeimC3_17240 [Candidatus Heimdallarchaeota archaeon LC_3]|nr:MAG: hypothetical protein HeimC3_17240 [Candidatus Heimdallarchaeota archaeon LC_3]